MFARTQTFSVLATGKTAVLDGPFGTDLIAFAAAALSLLPLREAVTQTPASPKRSARVCRAARR